MALSPEQTPIQRVANTALKDFHFQSWLLQSGFCNQDSPQTIAAFEKILNKTALTEHQARVLRAHRPFGFLTTTANIAEQIYGFTGPAERHDVASHSSRMWKRIKSNSDNIDLTLKRGDLLGVGASTNLTAVEIGVLYLLPWREADAPITTRSLSLKICENQEDDDLLQVADNQIRTYVGRVRNKSLKRFIVSRRIESDTRHLYSLAWQYVDFDEEL